MPNRFLCIGILFISILLGCSRQGKQDRLLKTDSAKDKISYKITILKGPVAYSQGQKQARLNPFLTEKEEAAFKDIDEREVINYLNLSAIFYSSSKESKAIIDGRIYKVGDVLDNKKIVEINPEEIVLKDASREYVLKIKRAAI